MPTRITVLKDVRILFLEPKLGGGFRKAGFILDLKEDMPTAIRNHNQRANFSSCVVNGYIKVEYIITPQYLYNSLVTPQPAVEAPPENVFKRGAASEDGLNKDVPVGVEIPVKESEFAGTEETIEEGNPDGGIVPSSGNVEKYFEPVKMHTETAVTEIDMIRDTGSVEEVEEKGDSEYMKGASLPSEKPYTESEVNVPDGYEAEGVMEANTAHMAEPEYKLDEVIEFLVAEGVNRRVAKSAARIIVEPISDTRKQLSLYGINTGNLKDLLTLLGKFKQSKEV